MEKTWGSSGCSGAAPDVAILSPDGCRDSEATIIRGALSYCGCASSLLTSPAAATFRFWIDLTGDVKTAALVVRAGRRVSRRYCECPWPLAPNEVVVYGEPYAALQRFAEDAQSLSSGAGTAVLGPLFDVTEYDPPPPPRGATSSAVLTSLGCAKKCGYCSHGPHCAKLYGGAYVRRSRPWREVYRELAAGLAAGIEQFVLVADQFLSARPEENADLLQVAREWRARQRARPVLHFTVGPRELLDNLPLIEALARAFRLRPRLAVESFDDRTLAVLNLGFDTAMALKAVHALASLRLAFRINYLLVRPGMTVKALDGELDAFVSLAESTAYFSPADRLLLAADLFSHRLKVFPGAPVAEVVAEDYVRALPPDLLRIVVDAQSALAMCAASLRPRAGPVSDPLIGVIEVVRRASRS